MSLLDDLRFVIGVFFLLVAAVLVSAHGGAEPAASVASGNLNLFGAGLMGSFSVLMLVLTFLFPMKK